MGPNNQSRILTEVTDISVTTADGLEATSGVLTWIDNVGGTKTIGLNIKPHLAWEVQEEFRLIIYNIRSSSASAASGDISPLAGSLSLVVSFISFQFHVCMLYMCFGSDVIQAKSSSALSLCFEELLLVQACQQVYFILLYC